ncbi:MAG: nucleotide disphospho-sugar-binding domain-containing protein [Planctomycetota bacterium]|nr:nucleotide disphospho-sugar-binding domain-containing protein [Planctomycetota bacterium]
MMVPDRERLPILVFFHGHALAHTIRPLVVARALRARGYPVILAGRGKHSTRVVEEGFDYRDIETMPQERMDEFVLVRGRDDYHDTRWVERLVHVERGLMREIEPRLVIVDQRRTVRLSAAFEGVDQMEICNGYLQPGAPGLGADRPSIARRWRSKAPFVRVGMRHAAEYKPTHRLALMADVPEFYPPETAAGAPGWHYVGPLLDSSQPQSRIDCLDEGWDTSRPLVYLTIGSSGRSAEYLEGMIEAFAGSPYRLVITTAGRARVSSAHDNVRVFDYLPGELILARADVLVGVTGIGAIYQALRCGKPVLGVPEHADQRIHLGRVETLGLGRMLAREEFTPSAVLRAVDALMVDCEPLGARCRAFAEHLRGWDGGEAAADVVDGHLSSGRPARLDRLGRFLRRYAALVRMTPLRWINPRSHRRP